MSGSTHPRLDDEASEHSMQQIREACGRICGRRDSDAVTQDVLIRFWRAVDAGRPPAELVAWTRVIARRVLAQYVRDRRRRQDAEALATAAELAPEYDSPLSSARKFELLTAIGDALAELPASRRRVVELHYLCGQPRSAIALDLGVSRSRARELLDEARAELRRRLRRFECDDRA